MSYLSNYDDLCIHLYGRKIPLYGMGFFLQRNTLMNTEKEHGNTSLMLSCPPKDKIRILFRHILQFGLRPIQESFSG